MSTVVIRGGHLLCPATGLDGPGTLVIEDGRIAAIGEETAVAGSSLDATGCVVAPGFIDLHCDLADPGHAHREGLQTGTAAAVRGGFTTVCPSPDTEPALDTADVASALRMRGEALGRSRILPVAALTLGNRGERLTEMFALAEAGAIALGDGGRPVRDAGLLRRALEYARAAQRPVFLFPEDADLARGGVMHEGEVATRMGLDGVPAAAENIAVARAIALAELTGSRVHIGPISTADAVAQIARAKAAGVSVTAAVGAAHLHLTDAAIAEAYDPNLRVRPPLRPAADVAALRVGLGDGTIDAVASGHTPHSPAEKADAFAGAAPGMIGLETALGLVLEWIEAEGVALIDGIARLTRGPAAIIGGELGHLGVGALADVTVFDPRARARVDRDSLLSRARNTPFLGRALPGRVRFTLVDGRVVYDAEAGPC